LKRGDLITAVLPGNYGKPRPCVVVQSNRLTALDSVVLCPLTSDLETSGPTRLPIDATTATGLKVNSLVMADKVTAVPRSRCRDHVGFVDAFLMQEIDARLGLVLGLLD
jgi:mRNA interferase MazF